MDRPCFGPADACIAAPPRPCLIHIPPPGPSPGSAAWLNRTASPRNVSKRAMPITIATWNINSVRLRQSLVVEFLEKWQPDILCLLRRGSRMSSMPYVFGNAA